MLEPDEARALLWARAVWLLQGLPRGTLIALDLHAAQTDIKFEGYKLVPPGVHCLTWQASPEEGMASAGLRTALLQYTKPKQVLARTYDAAADTWGRVGDGHLVVSKEHIQALDAHLAAYVETSFQRLTVHLDKDAATLARVFGVNLSKEDATCDSFTPVAEHEDVTSDKELRGRSDKEHGVAFSTGTTHRRAHDARDDADVLIEGAASDSDSVASSDEEEDEAEHAIGLASLQFTPFSLQRSWPLEARGVERTQYSFDKSWLLGDVLRRAAEADEKRGASPHPYEPLLREVELAFLLFVQVNNAAALEHWAALLSLFCRASTRLGAPSHYELHPCEWDTAPASAAPQLDAHIAFLRVLHAQFAALPPTCWSEDLASHEPRVLSDLAELRTNIGRALSAWAAAGQDAAPAPPHEALVHAWRALCTQTRAHFHWDLDGVLDEEAEADDLEEGEDAPVVVEEGYPYTM